MTQDILTYIGHTGEPVKPSIITKRRAMVDVSYNRIYASRVTQCNRSPGSGIQHSLTFEFPSGIKIKCYEVIHAIRNVWNKREKFDTVKGYLYQKLSYRPVKRQNPMECFTHICKLTETLAHDLIEEIKVDFGVYERDNMIMFA